MSLTELLPIVNNLSETDKVELLRILAAQVPDTDLQVIFSDKEHTGSSPSSSKETFWDGVEKIRANMLADNVEINPDEIWGQLRVQ